jgi:transcriptional regulator with XRE-family HTH domain
MEIFGKRLQELRIENGLTQVDIANMCKVTSNTVSRWERGTIEPDYATLAALAKFFKVPAGYLLGIED